MTACDHTSVGVLVWRDQKLLLIQRKRPPFGFAPPAGHVDGRTSFDEAARAELQEEVALTALSLKLVAEGTKPNRCRRIGGDWHRWRIYEAVVDDTQLPYPSQAEAKGIRWCSRSEIADLARAARQAMDPNEGLEAVWIEWFKELDILSGD